MHKQSKKRVAMIGAVSAGAVLVLALGGTAAMAHDGARGSQGGPLASLVTNGTITQDEATAIRDALHNQREADKTAKRAEREAQVKTALASLVAKGTITQAQADSIAAHTRVSLSTEQRTAVRDALESVRESSRVAHQAEEKAERDAAIAALVTNGTLNQSQADAVSQALSDQSRGMHGGKGEKNGHGFGGHKGGGRH